MNTIADILTDWQKAQLKVQAALEQFKRTNHHADLTAYNDAVDERDRTPFQPALFN